MSGADTSLQVQPSSILNEKLLPLHTGRRAGSSSHSSRQKAAGSTMGAPAWGLASPGNIQGTQSGMEGVQQPLFFPDPTEKSGMSFFPRDGLTDNRRDAYPPLCLTQGWFLGQGRAAVTMHRPRVHEGANKSLHVA